MAEVKIVSVAVTGTIPWGQNPIYPGVTPVEYAHYNELTEYMVKIGEALDVHEAYKSYVAHPAVNLEYSGFITPDLIKKIYAIEERIADLVSIAPYRIPQGIIGMYDGSVSSIPNGWEVASPLNSYFVIGADSAATYPLHVGESKDVSALTTLFSESNMPSHNHAFKNAYFAEYPGYAPVQETRFGQTLGSSDSDADNSLMYIDDYTDYAGTDVSSTTFSYIEPKHIQVPFIMKSYEKVSVKVTLPTNIYINGSNTVTSVTKGTMVTLSAASSVKYVNANGYLRKVPCKYVIAKDTVFSIPN